jgi:NTE family protein
MPTQIFTASSSPADAPVTIVPTGSSHDSGKNPDPGTALCLSGGGYRAMLFHVGALWRLYAGRHLQSLARVSSVSGGSITAAVLGLNWRKLSFDPAAVREDFAALIVRPIRELADETIDADSILGGILLPGTIADRIAGHYRKRLFGDATLQDLPDDSPTAKPQERGPRFVINATNVQSGVLWRFSRPYMGDYRVGLVSKPKVALATAVAASSAFPPVLSPLALQLDPSTVECVDGCDLNHKPYTSRVVLSDGGVYDNLGLETAWKNYQTVLVSDGGGHVDAEAEPKSDWPRHAYRVLNLIDNQVRSLRKRQLIDSYRASLATPRPPNARRGAYWGIRSNIAEYPAGQTERWPFARTLELAEVPTRLKRVPDELQQRLINWGHAVCDAALRSYVEASSTPAHELPYPNLEV